MNPNIAVGYLAEQVNLDRRNGEAARGWQARQAAAPRSQRPVPSSQLGPLGGVLSRIGEWLRLLGDLQRAQRRPIVPGPGGADPALSEV